MDEAAESRAVFIRSELDWLTHQPDTLKRESAIRELRRYFEWWSDSLSERDQRAINGQFSKLGKNHSRAA